MSSVAEVTQQDFSEKVIKSDKPVVVDFWAPWCMPCRMLAPTMDKLAVKNSERVSFYKLNTDQNQALAAQYSIMSIPSIVLFKGGKEVGRLIGVQPEEAFQRYIDTL